MSVKSLTDVMLDQSLSGASGREVTRVTTSQTLAPYERMISCAQTGAITLTLPDAMLVPGSEVCIYSTVDASPVAQGGNGYTITVTSPDGTVNGGNDEVIDAASDGYLIMKSDGHRWYKIGEDTKADGSLSGITTTVPVSLLGLWVHDAPGVTHLPVQADTGMVDDLGVEYNLFGTTAPVIATMDADNVAALQQYARFQVPVPWWYEDGGAISCVLNCGMRTTIADASATVDLEVYRVAAPSTDICATDAIDINSLTAGDKTFTITPTAVVTGDVLDCRVVLDVDSSGGATGACYGEIYSIDLTFTART